MNYMFMIKFIMHSRFPKPTVHDLPWDLVHVGVGVSLQRTPALFSVYSTGQVQFPSFSCLRSLLTICGQDITEFPPRVRGVCMSRLTLSSQLHTLLESPSLTAIIAMDRIRDICNHRCNDN